MTDWEKELALVEENEPSERLRTAAQGLLFGFDELEAALVAGLTDREYDELLTEIRGNIDE